jgi:hypothetical protein
MDRPWYMFTARRAAVKRLGPATVAMKQAALGVAKQQIRNDVAIATHLHHIVRTDGIGSMAHGRSGSAFRKQISLPCRAGF